ncbi:MAG: CPBP family intramembrane metalloprotease [Phycisphaerales bacterium]|nr:CPBP family intramembrane metalloprotease [Phycisphaerales bacterium]
MTKSRRGPRRGSDGGASPVGSLRSRDSYFERSKRPLEILALVAPLVVVYEVGLVSALRGSGGVITNAAHEGLFRFFWSFGIDAQKLSLPALALPAVAVLLVLVSLQILARRPWTVHLPTVGGMVLESALFAFPLLVIAQVIARIPLPAMVAGVSDAGETIASLPAFSRVTMSIGAGIYEELIFRMVLLALLHGVLVDLLGVAERWGVIIAVVVSAVLFAAYHPLRDAGGHISWGAFSFFLCAGLYFGVLYVVRGFGIAVGAHTAYDIAVVLFLSDA